MGAEIWGLERSKFEKRQIYGFLKNCPQGPQKMVKMDSDGFPSHFGPHPNASAKKFGHFQDQVS